MFFFSVVLKRVDDKRYKWFSAIVAHFLPVYFIQALVGGGVGKIYKPASIVSPHTRTGTKNTPAKLGKISVKAKHEADSNRLRLSYQFSTCLLHGRHESPGSKCFDTSQE